MPTNDEPYKMITDAIQAERHAKRSASGEWLDSLGPPFYWREIQACLDGEFPHYGISEDQTDTKDCAFCGKPTTRVNWRNSRMSWQARCGAAGPVECCLDCKAWYEAIVCIMT